MRKRVVITISAVLAVVLVLGWLNDREDGRALDVDAGNGIEVGTPVAGRNIVVYFYAMDMTARESVELVAVAPRSVDAGLEFLDARVYERDAFLDGVPLSWVTGQGPGPDPAGLASVPVAGYRLSGDPRRRAILLRMRITSDVRPLRVTGLRVTYRKGFREHTQYLNATYAVS